MAGGDFSNSPSNSRLIMAQYIGKLDRYGKKIFEGDRLSSYVHSALTVVTVKILDDGTIKAVPYMGKLSFIIDDNFREDDWGIFFD